MTMFGSLLQFLFLSMLVRYYQSQHLGSHWSEVNPRLKQLRLFLIIANSAAIAFLLAIPIGKLYGFVEEDVDAAALIGWLIFFVPLLASALALCGVVFSRTALSRAPVIVAMPGSFLIACLSLYIVWEAPAVFLPIGIGASILFGFNVLALWEPFKDRLESPSAESRGINQGR